jgi:hypothetical protein
MFYLYLVGFYGKMEMVMRWMVYCGLLFSHFINQLKSSRKTIKSLQPRSAINNLPLKSDSKSHQKFSKLITPNQSKLNFLNQKNMIKKPSVVESEKS